MIYSVYHTKMKGEILRILLCEGSSLRPPLSIDAKPKYSLERERERDAYTLIRDVSVS